MESSLSYTPVEPVRPAAPYIGGKRNLQRRLVPRIEAIPHRTYAEVFVGMGGVFLRRRWRPQAEVINDWSFDVSTLYRVLQRHYAAFVDMLRFQITSRPEFDRLLKVDPSTLTDLERAARFLILQKQAFGGKVTQQSFGVSHHRGGRLNLVTLEPMLADLHERLAGVIIERLDFEAFLTRYDSPETLFYLDPPYWGSEGDYGKVLFGRDDFDRLVSILKRVKGRFILSINDTPETRVLFAAFEVEDVGTTYGVQGGARPARELIVTGGGRP